MNMQKSVPIENIYYLLCYAWNRLEERDLVHVSSTDCTHMLDLFARVLAFGTSRLLKRGPDRGYITVSEELRMLRGRIDLSSTITNFLFATGRVHCDFDELSHNVIHNRILKTTISELIRHNALSQETRTSLALIRRHLHQIEEIELSPSVFSRVQLNRNNAFYDFLLSVCFLIYKNVLAEEGDGDYLFQDFIRDPRQMGLLFQEFIRNFFRMELEPHSAGCHVVGAEVIHWDVVAEKATIAMLPKMISDISIKWPDRYLVIDTKFYSETMQLYYDVEKIHSGHLYQLCNYLRQIESKGLEYKFCEGMLLYPTVTKELDIEFLDHGHRVMVKTVDLFQPWQRIHERLLNTVGSHFVASSAAAS
jgi:5-methylcytosine-specific restriction enzyme subunit McrC